MNPENAIGVLPWPRWDDLYQRGLVKLDVRPDEEQFDDSWCEDPKENADLWRQIEREGVWDLFYCYRTHPSHRWTEQHFCGAFVSAVGVSETGASIQRVASWLSRLGLILTGTASFSHQRSRVLPGGLPTKGG